MRSNIQCGLAVFREGNFCIGRVRILSVKADELGIGFELKPISGRLPKEVFSIYGAWEIISESANSIHGCYLNWTLLHEPAAVARYCAATKGMRNKEKLLQAFREVDREPRLPIIGE